jgi:hypothetical protein
MDTERVVLPNITRLQESVSSRDVREIAMRHQDREEMNAKVREVFIQKTCWRSSPFRSVSKFQ